MSHDTNDGDRSRRDFLKVGGAAVGATLASPVGLGGGQ